MAYGGDGGENLALLKRTIFGAADFRGRSRRTELIYYWIATALVGSVCRFIVGTILPLTASQVVGLLLDILISIPMFALFARRLHDQNLSGWWALMLPVVISHNIAKSFRFTRMMSSPDPFSIDTQLGIFTWVSIACALAVLSLFFLPGTVGANRFGEDPRLTG